MIYGTPGITLMTALEFIKCHPTLEFHLTGSRFFRTHTEASDYDFFIQDASQVEGILLDNGFTLDMESYERDPVMTKVYRRDNIHVQIVWSAKLKEHIQSRLAPLFKAFTPSKVQAKHLWQFAFRLYMDGMDAKFHDIKL